MSKHDQKYFYEDEVCRMYKGKLKFGRVVETSEFTSSDQSSDDEDQVKPGEVRVAWYPWGTEEDLSEGKLHLSDRSLMPGDVVRRMADKNQSQRGVCRNVHVFASAEVIGTKQVIYGVKSEDLQPLDMFRTDILICKDGWVGIVRDVSTKLTLRFADGSKVEIDDGLASELSDVNNRKVDDSEFYRNDYYPGQVLFGPVKLVDYGDWKECSPEILNARKNKPHKAMKMTVEEVDFQKICVNWLCRANFGSADTENPVEQPSHQVEGDELEKVRILNVFEPCTVQIGDRNFYTLKDTDVVITKSEWRKLQTEQFKSKNCSGISENKSKRSPVEAVTSKKESGDVSSDYEDCDKQDEDSCSDSIGSDKQSTEGTKKKKKTQPAISTRVYKKKKLKMSKAQRDASSSILVVRSGMKVVTETLTTKSEVDVVWQDGQVENNVPSADLYPIQHLDDHEFFPGNFVVESKDGFHPHSYGVVQNVDYVGRFCRVKWFKTYTEGSHPEPIYVDTSECSVYDLKDHPDFKYRAGAIVIRVANWSGMDTALGAGQVVDVCVNGKVKVWWASATDKQGITTECWPQDLYKVGEYDSDDGELWADDEEDEDGYQSDGSWSTESEHEVNEEEAEIHDDEAELKTKLICYVEEARTMMLRLEEFMKENPTLETSGMIKKLVAVCSHCKYLDRLMGTQFFHESNFQGLMEKVKDQEKINTVERAVQSQMSRLFSTSSSGGDKSPTKEQSECDPSPGKDSGNGSVLESPTVAESSESQTDQVCARLYKLLKAQLVKAHEEVVRRYSDHDVALEELKNKEELLDAKELDEAIANDLMIMKFLQFDAPVFHEPLPDPVSPDEKPEVFLENTVPLSPGSFQTLDAVPDNHNFKLTIFQPRNMKSFMKSVKREIALLRTSLPPGITVKGFDDRMDLFSAMIEGPKNTPYEDGLFFFDFQLGPMYPSVPPTCHYISYCTDKLNPNLYEDGKVCVSLLGTWNGKGTETWTPNSNLLQLLVSIQGLILVREPYFNEAGYEKQRGTLEGSENSRNYNEMAVLKLVQSMSRLVSNPPEIFKQEIKIYCDTHAPCLIERLEKWLSVSLSPPASASALPEKFPLPDFPLLPASKGFCLSLQKALAVCKEALKTFADS